MKKELAQKYNHKDVEEGKYNHWLEEGYFTAGDKSKDPYTIVIPPPNVTGILHIGHAWDNTLQDIISRYKRMRGYDMLYLPGMDHAGIATQAKVDARLKGEGISRYDIGREKFLDRAWQWKEEYASTIRKQWAKLGNSLDYSRERFTMDDGFNAAVRHVFVSLYNEGLIYRGWRIINWDPEARTALSNIEVYYQEDAGKMYYMHYHTVEDNEEFIVATTRPETMFGDVCVVVNPDDEDNKHLIGKHCINPANGKELPIIGDTYIEIGFGTGIMKCTPAHDPNDYAIAQRHGLDKPICMNPDGTMNALCGRYEGMDRYEARQAIVEELDKMGLLVRIEDYSHNVGTHDRCKTTIEPLVKEQWFVKMDELIKPAVEAVKNGDIKLIPKRMEKTYFNWTDNIRDWCISRQLWWGHRIPAYYCDECGEVVVAKKMPEVCPKCGCTHFTQDPDTLDTWFSSALWPFSTLGWPEQTEDLKYFYPTDVLVTGYDIIFFWVIRMIFSGYEQMGERPFKTVLFHGLVRDSQGRKMSKSLGNGIDPLEIIDQYGADALRLTLITGNAPGNDMRFYYEKVEANRNFANKVWNASRFIMMNMEGKEITVPAASELEPVDKWILSKCNTLVKDVTENMENYDLGIAVQKVYDFIWDEFCDWYIEMVKPRLYNSDDAKSQNAALYTLKSVLIDALKLLHPYMPFITEEIFCTLQSEEESIMISRWPEYSEDKNYPKEEKDIEIIKEAVRGIRNIRTEMNVAPSKKATVYVVSEDEGIRRTFEEGKLFFATLSYASEVLVQKDKTGIADDAVSVMIAGAALYIPFAELVDIQAEIERLEKEEKRLAGEIARCEGMLKNEKFISKAPEAKVAEEKEKLAKYTNLAEQVKARLAQLKAM